MMSGIRQRVTGRTIQNFLILSMGVAVLWWLPIVVLRFWPGFFVASKEPWLLDLSDLNWQRVVINLVTKQGFRMVWVGLWSLGWMMAVWLHAPARKSIPLKRWKQRLSRVNFRSSMEWAMDDRRGSALKEYAQLVGVI